MMMVKQDHMAAYEIEFSDKARVEDRKILSQGLDEFNHYFLSTPRVPCYGFIREGGMIIGGMAAEIYGDSFYIKHLWVDDDHRGQGLGTALMEEAEAEALKKNCRVIWVDTMSYQAPEFYKKHGYREVGRIVHYREMHDRIFYKKETA